MSPWPSGGAVYACVVKFERIAADPKIMGGVPCIRGTRIPVASILGYMAAGMTHDEIRADFPQLPPTTSGRRFGTRLLRSVSENFRKRVRFFVDENLPVRGIALHALQLLPPSPVARQAHHPPMASGVADHVWTVKEICRVAGLTYTRSCGTVHDSAPRHEQRPKRRELDRKKRHPQ